MLAFEKVRQWLGLTPKEVAKQPAVAKDLVGEVVSGGDPSHKHSFSGIAWDKALGSEFEDMDKDLGGPIAFPMVTYKYLHECPCGRRIVIRVRALI